jgi:hypothetical protein
VRKTVNSMCNRQKLLVTGDSHVRGLSEKISNCLDDTFSVFGVTKPNADIEAITLPSMPENGKPNKGRSNHIPWWN